MFGEIFGLALMMARSYTGRDDVISLHGGYHGPTYGAQSVSGIAGFRHPVGVPGNVQFAPVPNAYRGQFGDDVERYLDALDDSIRFGTTGRLAAMILEPVQGYSGVIPLLDGYMVGASERIRAAGGLLIVDEVQAGVGRTGDSFWCFEKHGVVPDIMVAAKGIGNGFPLGAVVARRAFAESMANKFLFHTYGANPVSCAAGRAVLRLIAKENLQENARIVGKQLKEGFLELQKRHEVIGDVRGRGLMIAIEIVKDRRTKEPGVEETAVIFEETRRQGLVASKSGPNRNVLRMVPPLCLSEKDVQDVVEGLDRSLAALG